jgi:hypothetical protein
MEIVKTLSIEPAPFDPFSNYVITFHVDPAIVDFNASYINIPMAINETYATPGNNGAVANVSLGSSSDAVNLSTCNIRSIRVKLNGTDVVYTPDINRLTGSLSVYEYNIAQERLEEYLSGDNQNFPNGVANTPLNFSIFRNLHNSGTKKSLKFNASIRVQLKKILGGLADELRDLRKVGTIEIVVELDNTSPFLQGYEPYMTFSSSSGYSTDVNTIEISGAISGAVQATDTEFLTTNEWTVALFPFGQGDAIDLTVSNDKVIESIAQSGNYVLITFTTALNAGDVAILADNIGTYKQCKITNQPLSTFRFLPDVATQVAVYDFPDRVLLTKKGIYVSQVEQVGNDLLVTLSDTTTLDGNPVQLSDGLLSLAPLFLEYASNDDPLPDDTPTVDDYSEATFPLWVGQAVMITSRQGIAEQYSVISEISYSAGKATLSFDPQIATDDVVIDAVVNPVPADGLTISYPERWELVQYRTRSKLYDNIGLSNKFKKWVYDADLIPELPINGIYEKTFLLEPLTSSVVLCLCETNNLVSNIGDLYSYRLRIDGIDTTSRDILLNSDSTYKLERLMNGFQSLSENLTALATDPKLNPLSLNNKTYTILQDLLVDGQSHKLTVSIRNGSTSVYSQRNIRLFKSVITQF